MVVPGGGLSPDGSRWIACRPRYFLPVEVLSALFRRLFLARLLARLADKAAFKAYLTPRREIDWVVYAKEPFAGPEQVLRYLSRYTHRVAISNRRLVSVDENGVTFKYKDRHLMTTMPDPRRRKTARPFRWFRTGQHDARRNTAATPLLARQSRPLRPATTTATRDAHGSQPDLVG